jgi:hypothetical protein
MARIVEEGQIKGAFRGFKDTGTVFEFVTGRTWKQAAYKYHYHYAYMPRAKIIQEGSRYLLQVEGMNDSVEVRRMQKG